MLRSTLALLLFIGLASTAYAGMPEYSYISPDTLPPTLLSPPPVEHSSAWREQIQQVVVAQQHINAHDLDALRQEQHVRLELMTDIVGQNFTREHRPKTFALLDKVLKDSSLITEADKQFWHTRRPYLADPRVHLLVDPINSSPAYPSGHTAEARVIAEVLGLIDPNYLEILRAQADAIAQHRVEAGVHYPNDLVGGRMLAMLIVGALLADDDFQSDLAAARGENAIAP